MSDINNEVVVDGQIRRLAVKPDAPDHRDRLFTPALQTTPLPAEVDLRPVCSPVVDQGQLGSCTANAIASGLREAIQLQNHQPLTLLSRMYLYWHERDLEGTVGEDSGAYIRDGMKVLQQLGCAPEVDFPYVESTFTTKPTDKAEADAASFKITEYHRVNTFDDLQHALADGHPVVIGLNIYESFLAAGSIIGMMDVPNTATEKLLGGHAMLAVGYVDKGDGMRIICRNSWGDKWASGGYCYLPKGYWDAGIVFDMWTGTLASPSYRIKEADANEIIAHFSNMWHLVQLVSPAAGDRLHYLTNFVRVAAGLPQVAPVNPTGSVFTADNANEVTGYLSALWFILNNVNSAAADRLHYLANEVRKAGGVPVQN